MYFTFIYILFEILLYFRRLCTIYCHPGYSYDGKGTAEMSCSRRQNKWTSDVNKPCTGSGREMASSERIEKPAKGNFDNSKGN